MPATGVCPRESFPVTIIDVQDLGTTSLYVKWTIHDCYGIGGYEVITYIQMTPHSLVFLTGVFTDFCRWLFNESLL